MDNQNEINTENSAKEKEVLPKITNTQSDSHHVRYPLGIVIVVSFIFGVAGGLYGSLDLANRDIFQRWFGINGGGYNDTITIKDGYGVTGVVEKAGPAVVSIVVSRDVSRSMNFGPFGFFMNPGMMGPGGGEPNFQQVGAGTGFFVSKDGLILTNRHVVDDPDAEYTVQTNDGKSYPAEVVARDSANDLALLKIDVRDVHYLEFADSSGLKLGQRVIAIGNSLGEYQNTVTTGVISGINRDIFASGGGVSEQLQGVIQTDAAINPGNSGGPLLDITGFVVGVNTAVDRQGQLVGFAITSNEAKSVLDSYLENGKIVRPFLGVRYVMVNSAIVESQGLKRDYGALILPGFNNDSAVVPDSPADQAGLKANEIILELDGKKLTEQDGLAEVLKQYKPGQTIRLKVYNINDDSERDVDVRVGER